MDIPRKRKKQQRKIEKRAEYEAQVFFLGRSFSSDDLPYFFDSECLEREKERVKQEEIRLECERLGIVRARKEKERQERLERERIRQLRIEQERMRQKKMEEEKRRLEAERLEQERLERVRLEREKMRQKNLECERLERERVRQLRIEQERVWQAKIEEKRRLEAKMLEQERLGQERIEKEMLERIRIEERIKEREKRKAEMERLEQELIDQMRMEQERIEEEKRYADLETIYQSDQEELDFKEEEKDSMDEMKFSFKDLISSHRFSAGFSFWKNFSGFAFTGMILFFAISCTLFVSRGVQIKQKVLGVSDSAYSTLDSAVENLKNQNFVGSIEDFSEAQSIFSDISQDMDELGSVATKVSYYIPYASKLSSGKNLVNAARDLSIAGQKFGEIAEMLKSIKDGERENDFAQNSVLEILNSIDKDLKEAQENVSSASEKLSKVKIEDIPKEKREEVAKIKRGVEDFNVILGEFSKNTDILVDLFGGNGPRKYLFLFQNNNEMRPTGGFIGSYGLIDMNDGKIRKFFIDGIYNPDGQLVDKVVPPKPIQKISAAWSLHDSNWFADFPTSARKAVTFYEKTGGSTVDGVVTFTPDVMQKLLKITGPIYMEEYDVVIDSENFVEKIQFEVEVDYDKEENEPKKILADLAPILLDKLLNSEDLGIIVDTLLVFDESLREKHILLYSSNERIEGIISKMGWSGEVLDNSLDYISVVNTNINGYKTDGVIDERIEHSSEILGNGEIINTVRITRRHNGGDMDYEWWNKVNANYMRVYVPKGSKLLSVEGQTKEINESPLDYDALGFERDADVEREENSMVIDPETTTRIYEEGTKTVFGNWVYVSPKEEVVVEYKYLLPFSLDISDENVVDSYSLLVQKQSGSVGSEFVSRVKYPSTWNVEWKTSNEVLVEGNEIVFEDNLVTDKFFGVVLHKK